jgi:glutathione S-transferase
MIQFYGSPRSSAVRSRWMLEETGVPYEYHLVKVREGGARSPEFLAVSPGGKIPALVDGDVRLAESMAINFYLAEKYRPEMWSRELVERARIYQWSFWATTNLQPEAMRVMRNMVLLPETDRDPDEIDLGKREAERLIGVLEAALTRDYIIGVRFTVADVNAGSVVNTVLRAGAAGAGPRVAAWMERLRARPAFQRATAD